MKDMINSVFLICLMGFLFYQTTLIDAESRSGLDALLLPRMTIGIVALLSIILFIQSLIKLRQEEKIKANFSLAKWIKQNKEVFIVFISFGVYVLLLNQIGFIFATILLLFFLTGFIIKPGRNKKRWLMFSIYNVSFTLFIYYTFTVILKVILPK